MGIFSRKPSGPHVMTFQKGTGLVLEVTADDFHSTDAGLTELAGRVRKDGEPTNRSLKVWLVRNDRERVDVISQKTGERVGRVVGTDGAELHDVLVKNERQVNGPLHFATTLSVEVEWEEDEPGEWEPVWEAWLGFSNPIKAKLERYGI